MSHCLDSASCMATGRILQAASPARGFFPGFHVFPGGHLETQDAQDTWTRHLAHTPTEMDCRKICAMRETVEETGIWPFSPTIATFHYDHRRFMSFVEDNAVDVKHLVRQAITPWIRWRTPDCPAIYPQMWDVQLLCCVADQTAHNPAFSSAETVEVEWMSIHDALARTEKDAIHLAPPQWFVLKQLEAFTEPAAFLAHVREGGWPELIQPVLVSNREATHWHAVLPGDKHATIRWHAVIPDDKHLFPTAPSIHDTTHSDGPFHRIAMRRKDGRFCMYTLISRK